MNKIGIIFTIYNLKEYLDASLEAWVQKRQQSPEKFVICVLNIPFKGYPNKEEDGTRAALKDYLDKGLIDHLITSPENISEIEGRTLALQYLKSQNCDISWQYDGDEFITTEQIDKIIKSVNFGALITWFKLSYKNYIFDDKTYLIEPFTPPRIHRLKYNDMEAEGFWADNNIYYVYKPTGQKYRDIDLSSFTIGVNIAWIKHLTWQNNSRSRDKINYQLEGRGWPECSFSWDENKGGLIFNPKFIAPKVGRD